MIMKQVHTKICDCPICGKRFVVYNVGEWLFKKKVYSDIHSKCGKMNYYCSRSCKQKAEKEIERKKRERNAES